jgi:RNA polymerase sigma factor (sigma-70 family)
LDLRVVYTATMGEDARLVAASLAGDRAAFAAIYDRYADRLHDFCASMLRNREEAADATQDTFVVAAERLGQLRDRDRLRPWLYAIARSQALRRLRERRRFDPAAEVTDVPAADAGPERAAEQADLRALVWEAAAGLADRDRALLDLHLRQGLDGAELGEAMGVSGAHAAVLLHRLRAQVERSLGALLVARVGSDDCTELRNLLQDWDGSFSPLLRKRVARHVDGCEVCSDQRARLASPLALLSSVPLLPAPAELRDKVLERARPGGGGRSGWKDPTRIMLVSGFVALWVGAGVWVGLANRAGTPGAASPTPAPAVEAVAGSPSASAPDIASPPSAVASPSVATPVPAGLSVSATTVDLGAAAESGSVTLNNTGGSPLEWSAAPGAPWAAVAPSGGRLGPGEQRVLALSGDRSGLPEGAAETVIDVTSAAGSADIRLVLAVERPPEIGLTIAPGAIGLDGCPTDTALVTATIGDESGVGSAGLAWSGAATGGTQLTERAGAWYGRVGPSADPGFLDVTVEAVDSRGNRGTASAQVEVAPCRASPRPEP